MDANSANASSSPSHVAIRIVVRTVFRVVIFPELRDFAHQEVDQVGAPEVPLCPWPG